MTAATGTRGRPRLYRSYDAELALLNTPAKRRWTGALLAGAVVVGLRLPDDLAFLLATAFVAAIGAIGLNLVTGYAGQISLGHAFFLGLGAYTAAVLGGARGQAVVGLGLPMVLWLPAAGVVAAVAGLAVSPIAFRLRGLYLAAVTLGLVFIGEHVFREAKGLTGGSGIGRTMPSPALLGFHFDEPHSILGLSLARPQGLYLLGLAALVVMALAARNLARSQVGRAFAAVRDRDLAAAMTGVPLRRYKALAFTVSSFYAGVAGALLYSMVGFVEPGSFNLALSAQYIAMILIGGVATISGSMLGAGFVVLLPRLVQELPRFLPFISGTETGGFLTTAQLEQVLYGSLIVVFLIFEPRGLYGIWTRARNFFTQWPFSY